MKKLAFKEWQQMWAGRTFRCIETGQTFTIPDNVQECDFFAFGKCFIDVGRVNFYCRFGGKFVEITGEKE